MSALESASFRPLGGNFLLRAMGTAAAAGLAFGLYLGIVYLL